MRFFLIDKILLTFTILYFFETSALEVDKELQHSKSIIDWIKSNNGFIHPSLEMRHSDPSNLTSAVGMFAKADIREGTLLFSIPDELVLRPSDGYSQNAECGLVRALLDEWKKNDESAYAPFIKYLMDAGRSGKVPSAWSDAGKKMLMTILGYDDLSAEAMNSGSSRHKSTLPLRNPPHGCMTVGGSTPALVQTSLIIKISFWTNLLR